MNKKKTLILSLLLVFVGLFAITYRIPIVGADSGFDSSWDSDWGSDWDSDWDSNWSNYDYGSYIDRDRNYSYSYSTSSSASLAGTIIFFCCILAPILLIIIISITGKAKEKKIIDAALNSKLDLLDVNKFPEAKRLEIQAFNIYKELQYAWMNFDEDKIRELTTDEMYNMYLMQLDTLKVKNQKNLMYDIRYLASIIKSRKEENGQETIVINMQVSCYDFLIDTNTNKVVRGQANKINYYNYELTFVKTADNKELNICPSCGAPVEGNNSGVCEYCKSTLINNNYTLVMSKKKMLSQK